MMQPVTLPPWLSPWSSGLLYGQRVYKGTLRERYRPRDRHRPRLTIYTYNHDDSHILRIGGWGSGAEAGSSTNTVRPLGWERYGMEREPWRLAAVPAHAPPPPSDLYREIHIKSADAPVPAEPGGAGAGTGSAAAGDGGWGAARGWAAGTALLALLVVLARAAENCIDRKFFKLYSGAGAGAGAGRRRSEEWPTPNVFATSQQQSINDGRVDVDSLPPTITVDLPPPYSECTSIAAPKPDYPEEPPPPYSDCYVEFSNKNGIPSVLIFSRRRNSILNRHEIVGSREEATTSDGRTDDTQAVTLEDIRLEERRNNLRDEITINLEYNDETAQTSSESAPSAPAPAPDVPTARAGDVSVGGSDIPEVSTLVVNTDNIESDHVKVV